jgi:hypothetical protein
MRRLLIGICTLLAAGLGLYPLTLVDASAHLLIAAAAATVLFGLAATLGLWRCAGAGALLIVGEYAVALVTRDSGIDAAAIGVGVALLIELEVVDVAALAARKATVEREVLFERVRFAVAAGLAGVAGGSAALVAGALATGGHPLIFISGACAAVGAVWVAVMLARKAVLGP